MHGSYLYENGTVTADRYAILSEKGLADYIIWDTRYSVERLLTELSAAGFRIEAIYGGVCGEPYESASETLCVVSAPDEG